jgi:WG repeat protein
MLNFKLHPTRQAKLLKRIALHPSSENAYTRHQGTMCGVGRKALMWNSSLKTSLLVLIAAASTLNPAQLGNSNLHKSHNGLFPVQIAQEWGFINDVGEMVIPAHFDNVGEFSDDVAAVELKGKWGYIRSNGEFLIEPRFEETQGWAFNNGLACVVVGDRAGFIDKAGNIAIPLQFLGPTSFSEGLAPVHWTEAVGYIDTTGKVIGRWAGDGNTGIFSEGLAAVEFADGTGFVDQGGNVVIKAQFLAASKFSEGLAAVVQKSKQAYVDRSGQIVIGFEFEGATDFSEGLAVVSEGGRRFFINKMGVQAIPGKFFRAASFSEGLAAVRVGETDKVGFIDSSGAFVITPKFEEAAPFSEGLARVKIGEQWIYIDKKGKTIWSPKP